MNSKIHISITSDDIALIRSKLAYVDVQIAELKIALDAHQTHVRETLLDLVDRGADKS